MKSLRLDAVFVFELDLRQPLPRDTQSRESTILGRKTLLRVDESEVALLKIQTCYPVYPDELNWLPVLCYGSDLQFFFSPAFGKCPINLNSIQKPQESSHVRYRASLARPPAYRILVLGYHLRCERRS